MAIYGIGATYGSNDVSPQFIQQGIACVGWSPTDAPALHEILRCLKIGNIVYIKTAPIGQDIRIKAIGIVEDNTLQPSALGIGVKVKWIWQGNTNLDVTKDKYNVRNITLYEEFNPLVQKQILDLLFTHIH